MDLTLPSDLPASEAQATIEAALVSMTSGSPPEVQVFSYGPAGITYPVKHWVPRHDREPASRTEIFTRVDAALREAGFRLTPDAALLHAAALAQSGAATESAT